MVGLDAPIAALGAPFGPMFLHLNKGLPIDEPVVLPIMANPGFIHVKPNLYKLKTLNWLNLTYKTCLYNSEKHKHTLLEKSRIILPEKVVKSALRQKSRKQILFLTSYF